MTIQEAMEKPMSYCRNHRECVKLIPVIRRVLAKFDGKVYNKRLKTALDNAAQEMQGGAERPELFFTVSQSMNKESVYIYGHLRNHYSDQPILCRLFLKDGRIDAAQGLKSCTEQYTEILANCSAIEQKMQEMPQILARLEELHKLQEQIVKGIPSTLYYDFDMEHVLKYGAAWKFPELKTT